MCLLTRVTDRQCLVITGVCIGEHSLGIKDECRQTQPDILCTYTQYTDSISPGWRRQHNTSWILVSVCMLATIHGCRI